MPATRWVTIDADLQDDVNAIYGFLEKYREGCDVVYGVRKDRSTDTAFKRSTAQGFYRLMHKLGVEMVYNAADYRLLSRPRGGGADAVWRGEHVLARHGTRCWAFKNRRGLL